MYTWATPSGATSTSRLGVFAPRLIVRLARRSRWEGVGLSEHVALEVADATRMECVYDDSVDAVSMIHVGMNVADKRALAREVARVL